MNKEISFTMIKKICTFFLCTHIAPLSESFIFYWILLSNRRSEEDDFDDYLDEIIAQTEENNS